MRAKAAPVASPPVHHVFDITRNGKKIGKTVVDINKVGDTTTVSFNTHISIEVLFVQAYHYDATATEVWKAGHFVSYQSQTDDHGKHHTVMALAKGGKLDLTVDGKEQILPQIILPASLWDKDFIDQTQLFEPDKGKIVSVKVTDLGSAPLDINGDPIPTEHYRISGKDFGREVWISGDTPVRVKLMAPDHSAIISTLHE